MPRILKQLSNSSLVIIGVVFIWRGAWVILDVIDHRFFGGNDVLFAFGLILVGLALYYIHDHKYDKLDHF